MDLKAEEDGCSILSHGNTGENEERASISKPSINFILLLTQEISGKEVGKSIEGQHERKGACPWHHRSILLFSKAFYQLPCNAPSSPAAKVDLCNLFLGVAVEPISPFWFLRDRYLASFL